MVQKIRSIVFIVIGIVAIVFSIKCYNIDDLNYESRSMYGGDAYTGIQNAAAMTSRNVKELASIVQFGFGSVLLIMGLTLMGVGLTTPISTHKENSQPIPSISNKTSAIEVSKEDHVEKAKTEDEKV